MCKEICILKQYGECMCFVACKGQTYFTQGFLLSLYSRHKLPVCYPPIPFCFRDSWQLPPSHTSGSLWSPFLFYLISGSEVSLARGFMPPVPGFSFLPHGRGSGWPVFSLPSTAGSSILLCMPAAMCTPTFLPHFLSEKLFRVSTF